MATLSVLDCAGCTVCCDQTPSLVLHPELGDDPSLYETTPDGKRLAPNGTGRCRYSDGGCTIYDRRPVSCRLLDCRAYAAAVVVGSRHERRRILATHPNRATLRVGMKRA